MMRRRHEKQDGNLYLERLGEEIVENKHNHDWKKNSKRPKK
jgi:hypothetical protein